MVTACRAPFRLLPLEPADGKIASFRLSSVSMGSRGFSVELSDREMSILGRDKSRWQDEDAWGELSGDGRTFTYKGKVLRKETPSR